MLSKPGEARRTKSGSTPSSRRQKKVDEGNPDDVVRKLQRLPTNKACADCSSKVCLDVSMLLNMYSFGWRTSCSHCAVVFPSNRL